MVLSASYPCRALGVGSAMPMSAAVRMAPRAVVLEPNMAAYRHYSERIMAIFREVTPLVEPVSVDEAFLDVTGSLRRLGHPQAIGEMLRHRIRTELGLPASVGIARNKFVAKVASTHAKPDGLLAVPPARTAAVPASLPVRALWGVGARTGEVLARARHPYRRRPRADAASARSTRCWARPAARLHPLAWGMDERPVEPVRVEKSIGAEETFEQDVADPRRCSARAVAAGVPHGGEAAGRRPAGRNLALKLRYSDFTTLSRSRGSCRPPSNSAKQLQAAAAALLADLGARRSPSG